MMTDEQRDRYDAAHLLSLAASNAPSTLRDICVAIGLEPRPSLMRLARTALSRSIGAGNWREARAEAEARLRSRQRRSA